MKTLTATLIIALFSLSACQSTQNSGTSPSSSSSAKTASSSQAGTQSSNGTATLAAEAQATKVAQTDTSPAEENPAYAEVTFFDSYSFDVDLSSAFRDDTSQVEIGTVFTINDIPERLDVWFARIKKNGGSVKAVVVPDESQVATRGIFGEVFDVAVRAAAAAEREALYSPADTYDAILHYKKGTGEVDRVVFVRRPKAEG